MAPNQVPHTPEPVDAYAPLKTPEDRRYHKAAVTPATRAVGRIAQLSVVLCMAFYIFGQVLVLTPLYNDHIAKTIGTWWGVPRKQPKGGTKGHSEMTRPTYFTLFAVLPLVAIVLLVDLLRHYNVRRLSSQYVLHVARILRRKPSVFGRVSYWSFGEWLFFCGVVGGNVYVFLRYYISRVHSKKPKDFNGHLEAAGLTLGFTCLFNMAFLFLPATRNSAWSEFFNLSYANSVKYHRWLGVVTMLTAFLHCVAYYVVWVREKEWQKQALPCFNCDIGKNKAASKRWQNFFGEVAFLIFIAMGVTAIPIVRRRLYNVFYYTHQLFVIAVILLALHWQYTIWWFLPTLVLYCLSRAVSSVNGFSPVEVVECTALSPKLVKIVLTRSPGRDGDYRVGQFLYLNVPAISKLQWHAFTIASSPKASPTTVTVLLKSLGDWTDQLVAHADECHANNTVPTIYVDGFYGASLEMYDEYPIVCLVAGGIGVTPILSTLHDMVATLSTSTAPKQKVVFFWVFRELALLEEVAPVLLQLRELDPHAQHVEFRLAMTADAPADALDAPLRPRSSPSDKVSTTPGRVFAQPLGFKSVAAIAAFVVSILVLAILEYGTKIKRLNAKLWPVEQLVQICVVMGGAMVAVVAVVMVQKTMRRQSKPHVVQDLSAACPLQGLQIQTYRALLAELNVVVGPQPDVAAVMSETYQKRSPSETIGVFASGPETLKRSVEQAVAAIDATAFDLREEQFEL